jgi:putative ABC transport system permease protein
VISEDLWKRQFGGSSSVIGQHLTIGNDSWTVVGVMPTIMLPLTAQFWIPFHALSGQVIARVRPGPSLNSLARELSATSSTASNARRFGDSVSVVVMPLREQLFGAYRVPLLVLTGAAVCILLIGCANVASLALARALHRRREFAVRAALGANSRMVALPLIAELGLLGVLGALLGVLLSSVVERLVLSYTPSGFSPDIANGPDVSTRSHSCSAGVWHLVRGQCRSRGCGLEGRRGCHPGRRRSRRGRWPSQPHIAPCACIDATRAHLRSPGT